MGYLVHTSKVYGSKLNFFNDGNAVFSGTMRVATNRAGKNQPDNWQSAFFKFRIIGSTAELAAETVEDKKTQLTVYGKLAAYEFDTRAGEHVSGLEVFADNWGILPSAEDAAFTQPQSNTQAKAPVNDDPWGSAPTKNPGYYSDEPPF